MCINSEHVYVYMHCIVNILCILCFCVFCQEINTCFSWIERARLLSDKPWCSVSMIGGKVSIPV